jgi:hypothetical protein
MISFGSFPIVTLAAARAKRDEAKRLLSEGTDPSVKRKLDKIAATVSANNTFGAVAEEYVRQLGGQRLCNEHD